MGIGCETEVLVVINSSGKYAEEQRNYLLRKHLIKKESKDSVDKYLAVTNWQCRELQQGMS
jgi:hypothetical protein